MKYLICQDWENTTDNHAGMKHMCNLLSLKYTEAYKVYIFPDRLKNSKINFIERVRRFLIVRIVNPVSYFLFGLYLLLKLRKGDEIYLLEYMEVLSPQSYLARTLKWFRPDIAIAGLIHLTPQVLESRFSVKSLKQQLNFVDKILTFGNSLTSYLISKGIPKDKIITLFHYVDADYYFRNEPVSLIDNSRVNVIAMGNQKRNYSVLQQIVASNPTIDFTICKGVANIDHLFSNYSNVKLMGYMSEEELRKLMNKAHISLNVMDDTVGSNVITTSLAMGLAMIVSDVGSIRDYCSDDNSIFCDNGSVDSFKEAIDNISRDSLLLKQMQERSIIKSKNYSIDNFHISFSRALL